MTLANDIPEAIAQYLEARKTAGAMRATEPEHSLDELKNNVNSLIDARIAEAFRDSERRLEGL